MFHGIVYHCYVVLSVYCSLVVTCWERADLLALLLAVFSSVCHFPIWCSGLGMVLEYIDPDLCLPLYFEKS